MNRRNLIKSVLCLLPTGMIGLSGCKSKDDFLEDNKSTLKIIPKQTDVYKFSTPLTFNHDFIDELAEYNSRYDKSQIEVLYNNVPWPASSKYNEWIQTKRGSNSEIKNFSDFAKYAKHAMDNGFKVCYLTNSPKPFNDKDINGLLKDFYILLDDIYKTGIRQIKVASPQVATLINNHNKEFEITLSVLFEYHTTAQYKYLIEQIPNVKRIVVTKDENQNFKLLKSLKTLFPNIIIEMMLNEGCIKNCPSRFFCMANSETTQIGNHLGCKYNEVEESFINFYKNGLIWPWEPPYYSSIGINHFKIVQMKNRAIDAANSDIIAYLEYAQHGFESELVQDYIKRTIPGAEAFSRNIDYKVLLHYFPDMEFFVQHGHECRENCWVSCNYCENRAKKLESLVRSLA